MKTVIVF